MVTSSFTGHLKSSGERRRGAEEHELTYLVLINIKVLIALLSEGEMTF